MDRERLLQTELKRVDQVSVDQGSVKHRKMAQSPFVFFRGSAQLFYADLHYQNIHLPNELFDVPLTAIMGDCHTSNFGFLTEEGSHGDTVIFSPNDFDDACMGHATWDLLRYLCSLQLTLVHCQGAAAGAIPEPDDISEKPIITGHHVEQAMTTFVSSYIEICRRAMGSTDHLYQAIESIDPSTKLYRFYRKALRRAAGGADFLTKSALAKATIKQGNKLKFREIKDKFQPLKRADYDELALAFAPYMDDNVLDIVQRHNAGTGSVNMARYYFLVGPTPPHNLSTFSRSHIVEVKQQRHAAPLHYFPLLHPVNQLNPAHLTARCQRRMQRRADFLLDEVMWNNQHWLIRSRHHAKVGIDPIDIGVGNKNVKGSFVDYAAYCGQALALAHCRSDRRSIEFEQAVCDIIPAYANDLFNAAMKYAKQVAKDAQWLKQQLPKQENQLK